MFEYVAKPRNGNIVVKKEVKIFLEEEIKHPTDFFISDSGVVMGYRINDTNERIIDYCFNSIQGDK